MFVLSKKTLFEVKNSIQCRNRLAYELEVGSKTIDRYIKNNDPVLTTETAQVAIKEELGLKKNANILEDK